ncbi:MAG: hypothetical protein WBC91_02285 [Phototrophicaceae bacterium]
MTVQFFPNVGLKRWDIFVSTSISFNTLSSLIHKQSQCCRYPTDDIHIYVGAECQLFDVELLENFEILFLHSPIQAIYFVINEENHQLEKLDRIIRFMRQVYEYNVHLVKAKNFR